MLQDMLSKGKYKKRLECKEYPCNNFGSVIYEFFSRGEYIMDIPHK